jgi:hypothetical protein
MRSLPVGPRQTRRAGDCGGTGHASGAESTIGAGAWGRREGADRTGQRDGRWGGTVRAQRAQRARGGIHTYRIRTRHTRLGAQRGGGTHVPCTWSSSQ